MDYKEEISDLGLDVDEVYELKDALEDVAGTSEDFSEDLKGNEEALKEAAKQMSRYNKAVTDAEGKFDDWKDALKGNDLQKQTNAVKELGGIYADMFDLDADNFSDGFLKSAKNLDLMQKAMEGNEDAYNDMRKYALEKMKWNTDWEDFFDMDEEDWIGYNVKFHPNYIVHESYSGIYTYEIVSQTEKVYLHDRDWEVIDSFEPKGAFYIFPNIGNFGMSSNTFCEKLLYDYGCAIVPGEAFGDSGEGFARISYAYSVKHITQALERIDKFVTDIKKGKVK